MPPRGRGRGSAGHKGQRRHFTTPEEINARKEKQEKERLWRERRNEGDEDDEDKESGDSSSEEEESSEESSGEEVESKHKGVEGLIEIENPNRVVQKTKKAPAEVVTEPAAAAAPQLSRREREELEKQRNKAHYEKMHAAGLTEQARADLARLAIIRKQREEQARKKAEEKRLADEKAAAAAKK